MSMWRLRHACQSLNKCDFAKGQGVPCFLTISRYCSVTSHTRNSPLSKTVGSVRLASADMTPSTPVFRMHSSTSASYRMLPLATTGMETAALMALMASQSAMPVSCPFCLIVRPCTVSIWQPDASIILAYSTDLATSSKTRILHVTGTVSPSCSFFTKLDTRSQSSMRKAPYRPFRAIFWGHPKLRSTASTWSSIDFAAARTVSGSFPQNCAISGRSSGAVVKTCPRLPFGFRKKTDELIIGV
mmetsp:Transcript_6061/g.15462  ORF Transcript_6061/g.15462 Transcript_6061/m.15462 type:complete len:243 (+) Transcript_6061:193-921(+)